VTVRMRGEFEPVRAGLGWIDSLIAGANGRVLVPIQGAFADDDWTRLVLRHQLVHAMLQRRSNGHGDQLPMWLSEGLATHLGGMPHGAVAAAPGTGFTARWPALLGGVRTAAALDAAAAAQFVIDRYGLDLIRVVLDRLGQGTPFAQAWEETVGVPLAAVEQEWLAFTLAGSSPRTAAPRI